MSFDGAAIGPAELTQGAKIAGLDEVKQTPEVGERIFDRGSGTGDLETGFQRFCRVGNEGAGGFDFLRLVTNDQVEIDPGQGKFVIT